MSEPTSHVCEAFHLIGELASVLCVRNINQLPRCWEHYVDEHWWISVNGHRETISNSRGVEVAPYNCWVEFNGWPAGYFAPNGGTIAAGMIVNEGTFIEALKGAIRKAEEQS